MNSTTSPLKLTNLVIRSGMNITDSRDNFHAETEADLKSEAVNDVAQVKFYEAFFAQIEAAVAAGKKTVPSMFRCQLYYPDAEGNIVLKEVVFPILGAKSIITLANAMEKLKAPAPRKARVGASTTGETGDDAATAAVDTAAASDDAAVRAAAEAKAEEATVKKVADDKAAADAAAAAKAVADESVKAKAAHDAAAAATAAALPAAAAVEAAVVETKAAAADEEAAVVDSLFADD